MNRWKRLLTLLLALLLLPLPTFAARTSADNALSLRGAWVSTAYHLDYPSSPTADPQTLMTDAAAILDDFQAAGINAVFLQVRPSCDALYESALFPWSQYLTGTAGRAPAGGFDPLLYWIDEAHARGMQLHAWINPYRVSANAKSVDELPDGSPARAHPDWVLTCSDGLWFDPGLPEVRQLVVDGAAEIALKYDIDGIQLDDYFYPEGLDDSATYALYASETETREDWRRANTAELIRALRDALRVIDPDLRFGVSPSGIWANASTCPEGSETAGYESYSSAYADTRAWVKNKLIDYIAPQIYWEIGHTRADFSVLVDWWCETVRGTGVALYIGCAAYRIEDSEQSGAWRGFDELRRQITFCLSRPEVAGMLFFRASHVRTLAADFLETFISLRAYADVPYISGVYTLSVARPSEDITTSLSSYYAAGASDVGLPLYVNGTPVYNRSSDGFWGMLIPLQPGKNTLTVTQEGRTVTRTVTRVDTHEDVVVSDAPTLTAAYPAQDTFLSVGGSVTLQCTAPVGADVRAAVSGRVYRLRPVTRDAADAESGYVLTTYYVTIPLSAPRDLGQPVYTMRMGTLLRRVTADGQILVANLSGIERALTASVTDIAAAYPSVSSGPVSELAPGMSDAVIALSGSFAQLSLGLWVRTSDVILSRTAGVRGEPATLAFSSGADADSLTLTHVNAACAEYDDASRTLTLRAAGHFSAPFSPQFDLTGSLFSAVSVESVDSGAAVIRLMVRDDSRLGGFSVMYKDGTATLIARRRFHADLSSDKPLKGSTILLDPGHGGDDPGIYGLLGELVPEKTVTLELAMLVKTSLETLGANVVLTRYDDTALTSEERVALSRSIAADLTLSLHCNGMNDNVDLSTLGGFCVLYESALASASAEDIYEHCVSSLSRNDFGVQRVGSYALRGGWSPTVLFQAGFLTNPSDFEWLIDQSARDRLAAGIAYAVLKCFS